MGEHACPSLAEKEYLLEAFESLCQSDNAVDVQMICGLVENQHVWLYQIDLGKLSTNVAQSSQYREIVMD